MALRQDCGAAKAPPSGGASCRAGARALTIQHLHTILYIDTSVSALSHSISISRQQQPAVGSSHAAVTQQSRSSHTAITQQSAVVAEVGSGGSKQSLVAACSRQQFAAVTQQSRSSQQWTQKKFRLTYKQPWADISLAPRPARPGHAAAAQKAGRSAKNEAFFI